MSIVLIGGSVIVAAAGCASRTNPSFPITRGQAAAALARMEEDPRPFDRPVVVLSGIFDPGFASSSIRRRLQSMTPRPDQVISIAFVGSDDFDACRDRVVEQVERAWPSEDPEATIEVDVVAVSMGGLVARYAARPLNDGGKRLSVRRLYTLATPHLGAKLAGGSMIGGSLSVDMRPGSAFLAMLNRHTAAFDPRIVAYSRLDDGIVGEHLAAPPGAVPIWTAPPFLEPSHLTVATETRFLADIAARLRDEAPFVVGEPTSLPDG